MFDIWLISKIYQKKDRSAVLHQGRYCYRPQLCKAFWPFCQIIELLLTVRPVCPEQTFLSTVSKKETVSVTVQSMRYKAPAVQFLLERAFQRNAEEGEYDIWRNMQPKVAESVRAG